MKRLRIFFLITSLTLTTNLFSCFCQSNDDGSDDFDQRDYSLNCYICAHSCLSCNPDNSDNQTQSLLAKSSKEINEKLLRLKQNFETIMKGAASGKNKALSQNLIELQRLSQSPCNDLELKNSIEAEYKNENNVYQRLN